MPEYTIPDSYLPAAGTYEGAGVPGGITHRETIHSTITGDATDQTSEVAAAISACTNGQVVKLVGTIEVTSVTIPFGKQITLRGEVDANGYPTTTLVGGSVQIGTNYSINYPPGGLSVVVASLTKGSTSIEVSDSTDFAIGQWVRLVMTNDPVIPVFNVYTNPLLQSQWVRITAKPDSTHYTIAAPGCHGDYTTAPGAILLGDQNNFQSTAMGLEDVIIDADGAQVGVAFDNSYGSWCRNVVVENFVNYAFYLAQSMHCEVRHCDAGVADLEVHTTGGHFASDTTSILFIDSIVRDNAWMTLIQGQNSGNVWAYNLFVNEVSWTGLVTNHGPWIQYTLYEGNMITFAQSDGYFGGSGYDTYFRNWIYGKALDTDGPAAGIYQRRGARFTMLLGNYIGRTAGTDINGANGYGTPNLGNSNALVPGNTSRMCVAALSTRTSDTAGTITAPSGHGVTTAAVIDVLWSIVESGYQIPKVRRGVTVGTVSGTSIPFSGGEGDALPVQDSVMYVPTSNDSLYNWWGDWDTGTGAPKEWAGTLTTRTSDTAGIVTLDEGLAADFETQWERAFTGQRGLEATGFGASVIVTGIAGNDVTFNSSSAVLPAVSTVVRFNPSNFGFQEVDMDVLYTANLKGNYYVPGGIPAVESLSGDTLPDSMIYESAPAFFAGFTWPPVTAESLTQSYDIIPAGYRYAHGVNPPIGGSVAFDGSGSTTFTGAGSVTFG